MSIFSSTEFALARIVAELNYTNPFGSERIALERRALGTDFQSETHAFWAMMRGPGDSTRGNVLLITQRAQHLVERARARILAGKGVSSEQLAVYDDLVLYLLFYRFFANWRELQSGSDARSANVTWQKFSREFDHWLKLPNLQPPSLRERTHVFSMLYQVFRAFFQIFDCVVGHSRPAAELRSRIWQSIFTHDLRRYRRSLHRNLHEVTTLVTGPSGSGKELVAQAIGRAQYIPFSLKKQQFEASASTSYFALNVSAFSVNLVESELFGYVKGAYTGAETARAGWLETCGKYGTLLLDEIGELEPTTQAKLLRVLQNRQYQRMGESKMRSFHGKLIAATNRDLRQEIVQGGFREDLYYRLCADVVTTPPLAAHLKDDPATLVDLVKFITLRIAPGEDERLTEQVLEWIDQQLPRDYDWPGNIRELEQCVRNIMIHNHYEPTPACLPTLATTRHDELAMQLENLTLTADELLTLYARMAYQKTGSFKQAAELLGMDRRTIRARCVPATDPPPSHARIEEKRD